MDISSSIIDKLKLSPITEEQNTKIFKDLKFISLLTHVANEKNMRAVVHGGYAVDGFFGKLTRPHSDIDVGVYGNRVDGGKVIHQLLEDIVYKDNTFRSVQIKDEGRGEWIHEFKLKDLSFFVELYYVQVKGNPLNSIKVAINNNGEARDPETYDIYSCSLGEFVFDSCTPMQSIVDRLYKQRRGDGIKNHHTQDIENLTLITSADEVKRKLLIYRGY